MSELEGVDTTHMHVSTNADTQCKQTDLQNADSQSQRSDLKTKLDLRAV